MSNNINITQLSQILGIKSSKYNYKQFIRDHISQVLSYFNAKNDNYNYVLTIPAVNRNPENGYAQFKIQMNLPLGNNSILYKAELFNTRVEMNVYDNFISIKANKAPLIQGADLLLFGESDSEVCYLSTDLSWLNDKEFYHISSIKSSKGEFYVRMYNINKLLSSKKVLMIQSENLTLYSFTGFLGDDEPDTKGLDVYGKAENTIDGIQYVQDDIKTGAALYYCFNNQRFTDQVSNVKGIAEWINRKFPSLKVENLMRYIYRAQQKLDVSNIAVSVSFKVDENEKANVVNNLILPEDFFDGNKIVLTISLENNFDTWAKKIDAKSMSFKEWNEKYNESKCTWIRLRKTI